MNPDRYRGLLFLITGLHPLGKFSILSSGFGSMNEDL